MIRIGSENYYFSVDYGKFHCNYWGYQGMVMWKLDELKLRVKYAAKNKGWGMLSGGIYICTYYGNFQ